jgi:hypothetical protein
VLLLLIAPLALLWLLITGHRRRIGFGPLSVRGTLVLAYLAFQALLLIITEVTSIGNHFTAWTVAGAWLLVTVVLVVLAEPQIAELAARARTRARHRPDLRGLLRRLRTEDTLWIGVVVVILAGLVVEGTMYPPANGDSLVYHLARVAHWVQNRTIAPFATHYLAQVELSPLSEYNLAHLHLLTGTNRFDWSMQWLASVVCIVGASELARLLGAVRWVQVAAAVICVTIPAGVLLATTTENDYFAAAIGIGLLIIVTSFSFGPGWVYRTVALGAAAGLAYMAKGTMPTMLGPAVLALFGVAVYRWHRGSTRMVSLTQIVKWLAVAGAGALAMVGPFLVQTWQLVGSVVGPTSKSTVNAQISLASFGANLVRTTAGNFDIGDGTAGISTYTSMIALGILRHIYPIFGISQNDSRFSLQANFDPFRVTYYSYLDRLSDYGANPWDVALAMVSLVILVVAVWRGAKHLRVALVLAVALSVGYILFSGVARWSPFEVRYAMPLMVPWAAVIAVALARGPRWITRIVMIALVVACLPQLLDNVEQPLVPPLDYHGSFLAPYFPSHQTAAGNPMASDYQTVTTVLTQSTCTKASIGNWVLIEYPLWVGLQHEHWTGVLNDFNVHNDSSKLVPHYRPCASITSQEATYRTPDNGTVNVQQGGLAISVNADDAATVTTPIRGWGSRVSGVRVLPGGGWSMARLLWFPLLGTRGSLYVFSRDAQTVQLQLQRDPAAPRYSVTVTDPDGDQVPAVVGPHSYHADIRVHAGTNRISLAVGGISKQGQLDQALFYAVTIAPATS